MKVAPFELADLNGSRHSVPGGRATLAVFLKEDCPTCNACAPLLEAAHGAFGETIDVVAVGQEDAVAQVSGHRVPAGRVLGRGHLCRCGDSHQQQRDETGTTFHSSSGKRGLALPRQGTEYPRPSRDSPGPAHDQLTTGESRVWPARSSRV